MVQSPDNESVDGDKCEREGVGGLSSDELEVAIPSGIHESSSHATSRTVGAGVSRS
jgi:hypothetical protein